MSFSHRTLPIAGDILPDGTPHAVHLFDSCAAADAFLREHPELCMPALPGSGTRSEGHAVTAPASPAEGTAPVTTGITPETASGKLAYFSTHWSVVDHFLDTPIVCAAVDSGVPDTTIRTLSAEANRDMRDLLAPLDAQISPAICQLLGLPVMPLLDLQYRYHGSQHLSGARLLSRWAETQLNSPAGPREVHFWHTGAAARHPLFAYADLLANLTAAHGATFHAHAISQATTAREQTVKRLRRLALTPVRTLRKLISRIRERQPVSLPAPGAGLAVLFQPEKNLAAELSRHVDCVLVWPREGARPVRGMASLSPAIWEQAHEIVEKAIATLVHSSQQTASPETASTPHPEGDHSAAHLAAGWPYTTTRLQERILRHFAAALPALLASAVALRRLHARHPVRIGLWTVPAVGTGSRLGIETLKRLGVPVVGMQHGGCYFSQQLDEKHFLLDFTACTHFFSYAAGTDEMDDAYPPAQRAAYCHIMPCCEVVPVGNMDHQTPVAGVLPVDMVFPVTNALDIASTGRTSTDRLARAQVAILNALEARTDLVSVVKPFPHASRDYIAITRHMARLRHARVVQQGWRDFLAQYRPGLAIIEFPSTPLYEALPYDMDIFLLTDATAPFAPRARALLQRRVHLFDTAEELTAAIAAYHPAHSPRLRDEGFYRTYVSTPNPKERMHAALATMLHLRE